MLEQRAMRAKQLSVIPYLRKLGYAEESAKFTEKLIEKQLLICDVYARSLL